MRDSVRDTTDQHDESLQHELGDQASRSDHMSLRESINEGLDIYKCFWPTILGLACARCSMIVGSYGSYAATDAGIYTDGSTLVAVSIGLIILAWMVAKDIHIAKKRVVQVYVGCVIAQTATLSAMTVGSLLSISIEEAMVLHSLNTLFGIGLMAFWLRYIRGSSMKIIVVLVFSSLAMSEIILLPCSFLHHPADYIVAMLLSAACFPLMVAARHRERAYEIDPVGRRGIFQLFAQQNISSTRFLVVMGMGIAFMAVVIGLLRGYPGGNPIGFSIIGRVSLFILAMSLCVTVIFGGLMQRVRLITVDVWVIMRMLAGISIALYAIFPGQLEYGAIVATGLNALMTAYMMYAIVAFMSYGWRDTYYYAIGGFTAFLLPRAIARMTEGGLAQLQVHSHVVLACMVLFLVISAEVSFVQFVNLYQESHKRKERNERSFINRFMGVDNEEAPESLEDLRLAAMKSNAQKMGEQFLLSDREVEVLALYAMGHTQQRVAEELFISPGTVHAHIKRIYNKTGLHSRQAVLDYLQQYSHETL